MGGAQGGLRVSLSLQPHTEHVCQLLRTAPMNILVPVICTEFLMVLLCGEPDALHARIVVNLFISFNSKRLTLATIPLNRELEWSSCGEFKVYLELS